MAQKAKYLYDDFSATIAVSGKWFTTNAATGVVSSGQMRITPTAAYDYVQSTIDYDLTGSFIGFKLVQNAAKGLGSNNITLTANVDPNNLVEFDIGGARTLAQAGAVYMREKVSGAPSTTSFTYNPAVHVWFRIRESSGTVYWETSTDGTTWTVQRSKATALTLTSVSVVISGGYWDAEAGTTFATIDDFNLWGGIPANPEAELLTDDFSTFGNWYTDPGSSWSATGGLLSCAANTVYDYCVYGPLDRWDMSTSHFAVQLVNNFGNPSPITYNSISLEFRSVAANDDYMSFFITGGDDGATMTLRERIGGVNNDTTAQYVAARDKWIRLRGAGGSIFWETSFNGVDWSVRRSKVSSIDLTGVKPFFVGGCYDVLDIPTMGTARLDNLNLTPISTNSGWSVGTTLGGGYDGGGPIVAKDFFNIADWMWEPIPDSPALDADSTMMGYYLAGANDPAATGPGISWGWYGNGIVYPWQITTGTPRYQVQLLVNTIHPDWGLDDTIMDAYTIPIPMGTQVPPGSDSHLCVMDPTTGKVFSFWQMKYNATEDSWAATYGGVSDLNGDGRDFIGSSTATNLSRAAGIIKLSEVQAGEIPHAIFVASNICRPGTNWLGPGDDGDNPPFVYPAQKSDGKNQANIPLQYTVVQGTRLQLNPALDLASIPDILPIELAIGTAWQRYGAYVGDSGGLSWPPSVGSGQVELWQGQDYTGYDEALNPVIPTPPQLAAAGVGWDYFALSNIPWAGNIRVLKNWDGSA